MESENLQHGRIAPPLSTTLTPTWLCTQKLVIIIYLNLDFLFVVCLV